MTPELIDYAESVGPTYGTEDKSIFFYSIVKMQRPKIVLELGTGLAVCTLLIAQALRENGEGHIWTVDDGSHWSETSQEPIVRHRTGGKALAYGEYVQSLAEQFGLNDRITLIEKQMPPYPDPGGPIDLLFCDFRHDLVGVMAVLANYLPTMNKASSIYIDSASTYYPSYLLLERIVELFNRGQVPEQLLHVAGDENEERLLRIIPRRRFILVHLTERKNRDQNSMAWLKVEPHDVVPHPRTELRG